jgi:hypothetical protein
MFFQEGGVAEGPWISFYIPYYLLIAPCTPPALTGLLVNYAHIIILLDTYDQPSMYK